MNAKKQTVVLTGVNAVVRALGLTMRVLLSRLLGAEIMGIMELAQSVHMVVIAPLTSGLPAAISRMTAIACRKDRLKPLAAGLFIARAVSYAMIPLLWLLSPMIARATGDPRVLPSLWFSTPCVLVLGYSAVYNGYCYGVGRSLIPSASELIEQVARLCITLLLLHGLHRLSAGWMAAVPVFSTLLAEGIGLVFVNRMLKLTLPQGTESAVFRKPVIELALPVTISRLLQTLLRSLTAILIPLRLQHSGLCAAEATARLGMLNGMVMPILMLPGVFTSALAMVSLPKIAKAEQSPSLLRRLLLLCAGSCLPVAAFCTAAIHIAAPFLAQRIFRLPELTALFRLCAPLTLLTAAGHVTGTVLSGLGLQNASMVISSIVSLCTLGMTWLWAGDTNRRIAGVVHAQYAGQILSILLSVLWLLYWKKKRFKSDGRSA